MGTLVNTLAVALGSVLGLTLKRFIPVALGKNAMQAIGFCTIYLAITGFNTTINPLLLIFSLVLGVMAGTALDLEGRLQRLAEHLKKRFSVSSNLPDSPIHTAPLPPATNPSVPQRLEQEVSHPDRSPSTFATGFVSATLLWCVGSMTILGCLKEGMQGDASIIYAKSTLDLISSCLLASTLGTGVLAACSSVLLIQGSLTLLASQLAPWFTPALISDITCTGSLLLLPLGFNLIGLSNFKVMNYTPALIIPIIAHLSGLVNLLP